MTPTEIEERSGVEWHGSPDVRALVEAIGEKVSRSASARAVFGEPVERDGTTVIPVAKVRFGFGGGAGQARAMREGDGGGGGGGGVNVLPLGFIEIAGGCAKFRRIRARSPMWTIALASLGAWVLMRRRGF
jgi:uncharacterized spore protein YtfJ